MKKGVISQMFDLGNRMPPRLTFEERVTYNIHVMSSSKAVLSA